MAEMHDSFPDRDNGPVEPSEWQVMLGGYKLARDGYLSSARKLWLFPTPEKAVQTYEGFEDLVEMLESISIYYVHKEDDDVSIKERAQLIAGLGRMCDEDLVEGLNDIGEFMELDTIFGEDQENIFFVAEDDMDIETLESGVEDYLEFITDKFEQDFDTFCKQPHFRKMHKINILKNAIFEVAKIGTAVTIGIMLSEKIRSKNQSS